eukprot:TRINITY_DN30340_c0_g1_i1.p2 TRINITY_DN30340_c0_g1~~TRINITY_DN30340_c0_g1_i1.p2  ORF type:complete len:122 (-),score=11.66 TRINITY_DN30340_c0_g1_i1:60-425(-)
MQRSEEMSLNSNLKKLTAMPSAMELPKKITEVVSLHVTTLTFLVSLVVCKSRQLGTLRNCFGEFNRFGLVLSFFSTFVWPLGYAPMQLPKLYILLQNSSPLSVHFIVTKNLDNEFDNFCEN